MVPLKHFKTQSRISLEILKQCSLNLAPEMYITKETKWHPLCHCHDNSYVAGPVLIKTNITRFYLKQGSSTPNNLMGRVKSIWESCSEQDPLSLFEGLQIGILVFHRKRLEPKVLPWQQHRRCLSVSFVIHILVPSLKNTAPIFLEIYSYCSNGTTYDVITFLICIIQIRKFL